MGVPGEGGRGGAGRRRREGEESPAEGVRVVGALGRKRVAAELAKRLHHCHT